MANTKSGAKRKTTAKTAKPTYNQRKANILSIILFAVGLLVFVMALPLNIDAVGWVFVHQFFCGLFGWSVFLVGPVLIYFAVMISLNRQGNLYNKLTLSIVFLLIICGLFLVFYKKPEGADFLSKVAWLYNEGVNLKGGGLFSAVFGWTLLSIFGKWISALILILVAFVLFMIVSGLTLIQFFKIVSKPFVISFNAFKNLLSYDSEDEEPTIEEGEERPKKYFRKKQKEETPKPEVSKPKDRFDEIMSNIGDGSARGQAGATADTTAKVGEQTSIDHIIQKVTGTASATETAAIATANATAVKDDEKITKSDVLSAKAEVTDEIEKSGEIILTEYVAPPLSLLAPPKKSVSKANIERELKENSENLVNTLKSFGAETQVVNIERGPTVTRYELQLAQGTPIKKITNHIDDIALNLASGNIRIEAPIPNKKAVGIEVPNESVDVIMLSEIIGSHAFADAKSKLTFALGKDIAGDVLVGDIAKMPHLLIAGATGSGKSVCVNSIIISLLYKATPGEVRLILIDPKIVELSVYNGIPHLMQPVVSDPRKAAGTLGWCVAQMEKRFRIFADNNVRDLEGYNEIASVDEDLEVMPHIVIIIDELADLMMTTPKEVEDYICRLAQKARAAGMHLIIATQRPSADVLTGTIKANIPSRIAFAVSDQINSRVILDQIGAEKLIGKGDMLYYPLGIPKPVRIQGTFVSSKEVENIVSYIKEQALASYDEEMIKEMESYIPSVGGSKAEAGSCDVGGGDDNDELMRAIDLVVEFDQPSSSFLMRKMHVGYAKSARLIDEMEEMGIVSPLDGTKRKVIISKQQWYEMKMNRIENDANEEE